MLLLRAVHVFSTFEFVAMRSDCLVQFSILTIFWSPMNCIFVHVSSTFEFVAMRSDCLVQFSILNLFGAPRIDCLALFVHPPSSPFFSEPHELRFRSCILHPKSLELCFMID